VGVGVGVGMIVDYRDSFFTMKKYSSVERAGKMYLQ